MDDSPTYDIKSYDISYKDIFRDDQIDPKVDHFVD